MIPVAQTGLIREFSRADPVANSAPANRHECSLFAVVRHGVRALTAPRQRPPESEAPAVTGASAAMLSPRDRRAETGWFRGKNEFSGKNASSRRSRCEIVQRLIDAQAKLGAKCSGRTPVWLVKRPPAGRVISSEGKWRRACACAPSPERSCRFRVEGPTPLTVPTRPSA